MPLSLNEIEVRVLGSLIEKQTTTPDYYPLSLNALTNACNQKSSREPVMSLTEDDVREALHALEQKGLTQVAKGTEGRVAKFEHRFQEIYNLTRGENAVICVLLLRGPQTPGELRGRTERMYSFDDVEQVQSTLQRLADREPSLVTMLSRQPGRKENRFVQTLSPYSETVSSLAEAEKQVSSTDESRIARLEEEVAELRGQVNDILQQFADFRKQFD